MSSPRNKSEKRIWDVLRKTGRAKYEPEKLAYTLECLYLPDFTLEKKKTKGKIYLEYKGKFDAIVRRKMKAVKMQHPDKDIRIIFHNADAKISKGSDTTHGEWAEKNGYLYSHRDVPKDWMSE